MITTSIVAFLAFTAIGLTLARAYRNGLALAREDKARYNISLVLDSDGRTVPTAIDPGGPSVESVDRALGLAILALQAVWSRPAILGVLAQSRIRVKSVPTWEDLWGREVGGLLSDDGTIVVGSDLQALAHEIAHAVERRVDRRDDHDHAGWHARGISIAIRAYLEHLP